MENRSSTVTRPENASQRTERLRRAFTHLESVLESVDLRHEPALADAVVDALNATDTALNATNNAIDIDRVDESEPPGHRIVFPIQSREQHAPRDRN